MQRGLEGYVFIMKHLSVLCGHFAILAKAVREGGALSGQQCDQHFQSWACQMPAFGLN